MQVATVDYIHIEVFGDLNGHYSLTHVHDGKTLDDPLTEGTGASGGGWSKIQPADEQTQLIADKVTL